jgi:hypothetical protein
MIAVILLAALLLTPTPTPEPVAFPEVTGETIDGAAFAAPDDFTGALNLVLVPFDRDQQGEAGEWLPLAQELAAEIDGLHYYSFALLPDLSWLVRGLVSGGLSLAVNDPDVRAVTVLSYRADQAELAEAMGLDDTDALAVLLLDADGVVLWSGRGPFDDALAGDLRTAVEEYAKGTD